MFVKGQFTVITRDAETLEIQDTRVIDNTITLDGLFSLAATGGPVQNNTTDTSARAWDTQLDEQRFEEGLSNFAKIWPGRAGIYLNEEDIIGNVSVLTAMPTGQVRGTNENTPSVVYTAGNTSGSPITPAIMSITSRFLQPGTARVITNFWVGPGGDPSASNATNINMFAYAALDTPCTQSTIQILDVTYRLQFFERTVDVAGSSTTYNPNEMLAFGAGAKNAFDGYYIFDKNYSWTRMPPSGHYTTLRALSTVDPEIVEWTRYTDQVRMRSRPTNDWLIADDGGGTTLNSGRVFRSLHFGDTVSNELEAMPVSTFLSQPATDSNFAGKPIQPIHNHSNAAVEPFLDVDNLASGTALPEGNGDNWIEQEWPEFYRIDIVDSGNVGTSTYTFAKCKLIRFDPPGGSLTLETGFDRYTEFLPWHDVNNDTALVGNPTITGGLSKFNAQVITTSTLYQVFGNIEEYNPDHYIMHDDDHFGIINTNGGDVALFTHPIASGGSPAFINMQGIQQIATDDDENVWVACNSGGLIKVTDPLGTPTAVQMTNADHGIPSGSDTTCLGVSRGFPGGSPTVASIWAVFDGAIAQTTDGGTSWTLYSDTTGGSPADFVWTANGGITNSNWNQVKLLRVDQSNKFNEMLILYENVGDVASDKLFGVWWSTEIPTTSEGPGGASGVNGLSYATSGRAIPAGTRCSRRGSFWIAKGAVGGSAVPVKLHYGSTTTTTLPGLNAEVLSNVVFLYDYYGNPYTLDTASGNLATDSDEYAVYNKELEGISELYWTNRLSTPAVARFDGVMYAPEGDGFRGSAVIGLNDEWLIFEPSPSKTISIDNWNGLSTPFEEFIWTRYNYNSTGSPNWQAGYHFPATDTSGNAVDGIRHNFFTEDHAFRGRSSIDISAVGGTSGSPSTSPWIGSPALSWTAVFTLSPTAKANDTFDGNTRQCLLSGYDDAANTNFRLNWIGGGGDDSLSFWDGSTEQTFSTTSAIGGSPISVVVLAVSGTTATCYLDGIPAGSPSVITIAAQSLANPTGELSLRVGSTVVMEDTVLIGSPATGATTASFKEFYLGTMRNVQLWNSAWDATDVTNHSSAPFGLIGSESPTLLQGRWELNPTGSPAQDLTGFETSATHAGFQPLDNGLTFSFGGGSPLGDLTATDFYTFGVMDGILKDNAISFTATSYIYHFPTQFGFRQIENSVGSPTGGVGSPISAIVPATGGVVTEDVLWRLNPGSNTGSTYTPTLKRPGQIGNRVNSATATSLNHYTTFQTIDATGGYIEARPPSNSAELYFGLTDDPTSAGNNWTLVMDYSFRLLDTGTYEMRELDSVVGGSPATPTYSAGDLFRITRVGSPNVVEYRVGGVLVYTSAVATTGADYGGAVQFWESWGALYDVSIQHVRPGNILDLGSATGLTGKYATDFWAFDGVRLTSTGPGSPAPISTISVSGSVTSIAGSPHVELVLTTNHTDTLADLAPAPGEVVLVPDAGILVFNATEQGDAIKSSMTLITNS